MTEKTLREPIREALQMASDALETLCSEMSEQSRVLINQDAINQGLAAHEAVQAALSLPDEPAERKPFTAAQRERLYMEADANIFHSMTIAAFHRVVQYVEAAQ